MYHATTSAAVATAFSPGVAIGLVIAAMATLIALGMIVTAIGAPLYVAMALGMVAMVALPWLIARRTGRSPAALGLRAPSARHVGAAVLVGVSAWYLNTRLVELIAISQDDLGPLGELVERPSVVVVLVTIALAPAICEEVLFRGVLLRALATRLPAIGAVVGSAVVFAVYHLRPIQMVPTFTLGVVLAVIATRADSVIPTMIAHLLNNAIALLVARGELPALSNALADHPDGALAGLAITCALGLALVSIDRLRGPGVPRTIARRPPQTDDRATPS